MPRINPRTYWGVFLLILSLALSTMAPVADPIISTAAGGGSGDDGDLATDAGLSTPRGVAMGSSGKLFIGFKMSSQ